MKEKMIKYARNLFIGLGIFFLFLIVIAVITMPDEQPENTQVVVTPQPQQIVTPEPTPEPQNEFIGQEFTIDSAEAFNGWENGQVSLWASYEDRTLLGKLDRYEKVTLLDYDEPNSYCQMTNGVATGWALCNWLIELPETMKIEETF